MLEQRLKENIAEVPDFPKPGISFKDITPVLLNPTLSHEVVQAFTQQAIKLKADYVAGIDARGFLFGLAVAQELGIGFIPVRKRGKLPRASVEESYQLEYGQAAVAVHQEDVPKKARILIHDDLLATGGTANAAQKLFQKLGAQVCGFQFLIELDFLKGALDLNHKEILSLCHYS